MTALTLEADPSLELNDEYPTFGDLGVVEIDGEKVHQWANFLPTYIYGWPIPLMKRGTQVVQGTWKFREGDETLELLPGDVCLARRTLRS